MTHPAKLIQGVLLAAAIATGRPLHAQVFDVHGAFVPSVHSQPSAAGFGIAIAAPARLAAATLLPSLGGDYVRRASLGPGRASAGLDVRLLPSAEGHWVVPFVGAGASANWSGGAQSEWSGGRLGLDALAGFALGANNPHFALKIEQRFGYVVGADHRLTTRLGLLAGL